jgi:hypothetical protein
MILSTHGIVGSQIQSYAFLLDTYTSAAAAYSLRKLRSAYTGSAIRVRRSSDNTEQDVGFSSAFGLDTSSLTSFCGSGNGFVTTWYDQSGNGRNATQTTAANQPQNVSAGSVLNENSKPSLKIDGINDEFALSSTITTSIYSNFVVLKKTSTSSIVIPLGLSNGQLTGAWSDGNLYENNGTSFVSVPFTNNTNQNLFSVLKNGNTLTDFSGKQNGTDLGSYTGIPFTSIAIDRIGARTLTYSDGNLQEIVVYSTSQASNRTAIESNINSYYAIY